MITARRIRTLPLAAALTLPLPIAAQEFVPLRTIRVEVIESCPAPTPAPAEPSPDQREQAAQLVSRGREAALSGDQLGARDAYRRAAHLDPTDESVVYLLARMLEELEQPAEAVEQYCRYLELDPNASDAADVRTRVAVLAPPREQRLDEGAVAAFQSALDHFDAERFEEADSAFTQALQAEPDWPEAYYNRALARARRDRPGRAIDDLERYLALAPDRDDRTWVRAQIGALEERVLRPGSALARGMIVPGLGQYYTRRPLLGVLVAGATVGAIVYGVTPRDVTHTESFTDPFGEVHEFSYVERELPNVAAGLVAAAGLALFGAMEAYLYAKRVTAEDREEATAVEGPRTARFQLVPVMPGSSADVGLALRIPVR